MAMPTLRLLLLLGVWGEYGGGLGVAEGLGVLGVWLLHRCARVPGGTQPCCRRGSLKPHGETPRAFPLLGVFLGAHPRAMGSAGCPSRLTCGTVPGVP